MTRAEVYLKAADIIADRGLFHGWFEGPTGNVCAIGAIRIAIFGTLAPPAPVTDFYLDCVTDLGMYLAAHHDRYYMAGGATVTAWSDQCEADEVVATLRAAAQADRITNDH